MKIYFRKVDKGDIKIIGMFDEKAYQNNPKVIII